MIAPRIARFALASIVLAPLAAADVLTVAPSGADFTQIQAAIDAAQGAVLAENSGVWIANSDIRGTNHDSVTTDASHGVEVVNSALRVWRSKIRGGSNGPTMKGSSGYGGSGIRAEASSVDLYGGPTSEILGGDGSYAELTESDYPGGPGVDLVLGSSARIQDDIPIQGGYDGLGLVAAPPVNVEDVSTVEFLSDVFPTLVSSDLEVQLGSSFDLTLAGTPGATQVLFYSLRLGPTDTFGSVGGLGVLDRLRLSPFARVFLPGSGLQTMSFLAPNTPALLGATLFFRTMEKSGGGRTVGNPVLVTITG